MRFDASCGAASLHPAVIAPQGAQMGETTLIHLSRMVALERKLGVIAQNVANANNSGFQARELSFQEYLKPEKGTDETGNKERPLSLVAPRLQFGNLSQGALAQTGNPLDVAIRGAGYLVVQTPQGDRYTRAGALTIDNSGRLVTLAGQPVLGKTGAIRFPARYQRFGRWRDQHQTDSFGTASGGRVCPAGAATTCRRQLTSKRSSPVRTWRGPSKCREWSD